MSRTLNAMQRPGISAACQAGPGFAVAVTEAQYKAVRVYLIGRLEAATAMILTAAFAARHERPGEEDVVLDLSALTIVDRIGMSILGVNRALIDASGRAVGSAHPHGADLRLLDCQLGGLDATTPGVHRHPALEDEAAPAGAFVSG